MGSSGSLRSRAELVATGLGLAVGGIVLGTAVLFVLAVFVSVLGISLSPTDQLVLSLVALQGIGFPGIGYAYFRYTGRSLRDFVPISVPTPRELGIVVGAWVGAFLLLLVGATVVIELVGTAPAENQGARVVSENPEFIPFLIPLVFLLNAPGEELLFRGVIQGLFREEFGPVGAILLATAMFAPIHIFALVGSPEAAMVTITILSIPSIVFGAVYEYTDNLAVPTLVHALYNSTLFTVIFVTTI